MLALIGGCHDDSHVSADAGQPDLLGPDLPAPGPGRTCELEIDLTHETKPLSASTAGGISQTGTSCDDSTDGNPELYFRYDVGAAPIDLIVDVIVDPDAPWDAVVTSRSDCA